MLRSACRLGKFLLIELIAANGDSSARALLVHLGMTGQLTVRPAAEPLAPHTHIVCALDDGSELRYADPRRFGRVALATPDELTPILLRLGADPLEISREEFCRRLGARRARIKALLLDQRVLRGVGNIYADESLWRSRIHPARPAARLGQARLARLHSELRRVLLDAIRLGGSSISDYVGANGERGRFQLRHRVYDREGKPCRRCGASIQRTLIAGRSSYYCPRCQRRPNASRRGFRNLAG